MLWMGAVRQIMRINNKLAVFFTFLAVVSMTVACRVNTGHDSNKKEETKDVKKDDEKSEEDVLEDGGGKGGAAFYHPSGRFDEGCRGRCGGRRDYAESNQSDSGRRIYLFRQKSEFLRAGKDNA